MSDVTRIWERLCLGNMRDAEALAVANPHGITTVISVCEDKVIHRNPAINYLHLPVRDAKPIPVAKFDQIIDAITENIRWGTILLHCSVGASRSPVMAASWMHVVGYKGFDAALEEIEKLRPIVGPSPVLLKSVKEHLG